MVMKPIRIRVLTLSLSSLLGLGAMCSTVTARAAMVVCAPKLMEWPLASPGTKRCYDTALNAAVRQVPSPGLLALYRADPAMPSRRG